MTVITRPVLRTAIDVCVLDNPLLPGDDYTNDEVNMYEMEFNDYCNTKGLLQDRLQHLINSYNYGITAKNYIYDVGDYEVNVNSMIWSFEYSYCAISGLIDGFNIFNDKSHKYINVAFFDDGNQIVISNYNNTKILDELYKKYPLLFYINTPKYNSFRNDVSSQLIHIYEYIKNTAHTIKELQIRIAIIDDELSEMKNYIKILRRQQKSLVA